MFCSLPEFVGSVIPTGRIFATLVETYQEMMPLSIEMSIYTVCGIFVFPRNLGMDGLQAYQAYVAMDNCLAEMVKQEWKLLKF